MYQINYLRCIGCGLCIEACPTRALTMTNDYEMADDNRGDLIYEQGQLLAPLLPGMRPPPHPMAPGATDEDYYLGQRDRQAGAKRREDQVRDDEAIRRRCWRPRRSTRTSTAEAVAFWVLGDIAVVGAVGVVAAPKAVYSASSWPSTMIALAVIYVAQDALFLGVVQVVVYTGAVMMLFLFVLMLIGVDSAESLVETLRGQRLAALLGRTRASASC